MRDFGATFAAELAALKSNPFWSVVVHFDAGDLWIAGRENDAGGIDHSVIMVELGTIGSSTGRSEPAQLDVSSVDLTFVNMPKHAGMPGSLATGERFIDRWVRNLEAVLADVYLNFETTPGTYVREKLFAAVCSSPSSAGYSTGTLHLASRTERYLNASALRKIQASLYPFALPDAISTIPIVLGTAPRSPGRIVKGSRVSVPVAGADNVSGAILQPPTVSPDVATAETWTVEVSGTETARYLGSTDGAANLNLSTNSGSTAPILAQSFTIAGGQIVRGVNFKFDFTGTGANAWVALRIEIWSDSSGNPGSLVTGANQFMYIRLSLANTKKGVVFLNPPTLAAGTYWMVMFASPGGHTNGNWGLPVTATARWRKNSGGGYGSGTAKHGTYTRVNYSSVSAFLNSTPGSLSWDTTLNGQDFFFEILFGSDAYTLTGSVTGVDGVGSFTSKFVSDSGVVTIDSDRWVGIPAAGDTFTFLTDPADSKVILSESPTTTPVGAITAVYLDDDRIATGTTVTETRTSSEDCWVAPWAAAYSPPTSVCFLTVGEDPPTPNLPVNEHLIYGNQWRGLFWPIDVVGTQTFRKLGWQIWHTAAAADQANPLTFAIHTEDIFVGQYRVPDRKGILGSVQVSVDPNFAGGGYEIVFADFPHPVTVSDRRIYIAVYTDQFNRTDFYEMPVTNYAPGAGPPGVGVLWSHSGAFYVGHNFIPGFSLIGATVTTELSVDDGTGHNVADVLLDFDIPPNSKVTADVAGITDDASGTYTGTAGALLVTPDQDIHWLLNRAGAVDADIDLDRAFAEAGAFYRGAGYRFDGVVQDETTYKTLLLKLAYECRSSFDWITQATLRVLYAELDEAALTVTLDDLLPDSDRVPLLRLERSADSEIINSLTINYNRILADTKYKNTVSRHVADSTATYGVLERTDLQNLDFVRVAAMARDIIDLRLTRQAYPFWRIAFTVLLPFLALEKDDGVALNLTNAVEGDALGGWDGSQVLQLEGLAVQPELPGLDITLREINLEVEISDGDGYEAPLSVVVLLDQGDLVTTYDYVMGYPPHGRWIDPSTSGGTVYDAILLNGWHLFIENGERKYSDSLSFGTVFTWTGPPTAEVELDDDGDPVLLIDF